MHVWLAACWLVDLGYGCGGEDGDGDGLRDCGFAVVLEVEVAGEGGGVGELVIFFFRGWEGEVWSGGREGGVEGCGDGRGARGERVGCYGEGEEGLVVCFGEAEGGAGGGEGGAESAVEVRERDAEVDGVVFGGGLEAIGFEDSLLLLVNPAASRSPASRRGVGMITIESTLTGRSVDLLRKRRERTHAHTCEPCSGITVKRTVSLSRRIQASLPSDERDAVNSGEAGH